jgi:hypothetical protein
MRVRQCGRGTERGVGTDGLGQVSVGVVAATDQRGQPPGSAGRTSGAHHTRSDDDDAAGVGREQPVEDGGPVDVAELGAHVGEHRERDDPARILRHIREALLRQSLEDRLRGVGTTGDAVQVGQRRVPDRRVKASCDCGRRLLQLAEPVLLPADVRELNAEVGDRPLKVEALRDN